MRDRVTLAARKLAGTFGSFTPGQKAVTVLGVIVLAGGGYVFSDDQQKPTASVLVVPASGKTPGQDQIQAVVHLVASSVVGLDPDQVTVASADGTVLSTGDGQAVSAVTSLRQQQTNDFEQRMNSALEQMLASVVGPGHVVVKTTADLDYDQTQTKTQTYVAPSPSTPPLSQTNSNEAYSGTAGTNGRVLGPGTLHVPHRAAGSRPYSRS